MMNSLRFVLFFLGLFVIATNADDLSYYWLRNDMHSQPSTYGYGFDQMHYAFANNWCANQTVYHLDMGIDNSNPEFYDANGVTRVRDPPSPFQDSVWLVPSGATIPHRDQSGHGTFTASFAVGNTMGICRKASIVTLKGQVFNNTAAGLIEDVSLTAIQRALNWTVTDFLAGNMKGSVLTTSYFLYTTWGSNMYAEQRYCGYPGAPSYPELNCFGPENDAFQRVINAGVPVFACMGNFHLDILDFWYNQAYYGYYVWGPISGMSGGSAGIGGVDSHANLANWDLQAGTPNEWNTGSAWGARYWAPGTDLEAALPLSHYIAYDYNYAYASFGVFPSYTTNCYGYANETLSGTSFATPQVAAIALASMGGVHAGVAGTFANLDREFVYRQLSVGIYRVAKTIAGNYTTC